MIRVTLRLKIRAGREPEFERAWRRVASEVREVPGNLRQALLHDTSDPGVFTITSDWADEASFRSFERSSEQDALTASIRALRESAVMTVDELMTHIEARHRDGGDPNPRQER